MLRCTRVRADCDGGRDRRRGLVVHGWADANTLKAESDGRKATGGGQRRLRHIECEQGDAARVYQKAAYQHVASST